MYLDSFPFSSLTSLLEAGSLEVPAITYRGHPSECAVFGADTRGVDDHMLSAQDPAGFARALSELIADPERRRRLGERTARAIRDSHTGSGWTRAVAELYALAERTGRPSAVAPVDRPADRLDALVDLVMTQTGWAQGRAGAVREHLGLCPRPSGRPRAGQPDPRRAAAAGAQGDARVAVATRVAHRQGLAPPSPPLGLA